MKIVIAIHHFPPHRTAGAELEAFRTAQTLVARGHKVDVICVESIDAPASAKITWCDDVYKNVPVRRLSFNLASTPDPEQWEYDNRWIGDHLKIYLEERKPDLFHLFSGYLMTGRTLLVAKDLGIPSVVSLMDFWFLCRRITLLRSDGSLSELPINPIACARCIAEEARIPRLLGKLAPALMDGYWQMRNDRILAAQQRIDFCRNALNSADLIINRSHFVGDLHAQSGINQEKMVFCRQGFANPQLPSGTASSSTNKYPSLRLLYLGQINQHKGIHILIQAVRALPHADIRLSLYGDLQRFPSYTRRLLQMAKGDERIDFAGIVPPEEIGAILQETDVLVVPSIWYENSPNTIAEAFAYKVPVIASNLGGMAELVQHGQNGLLFTAGDSNDLAQQLQRLLDAPALLAQLQQGIQPVKSVDEEVEELATMYNRLTEQHYQQEKCLAG